MGYITCWVSLCLFACKSCFFRKKVGPLAITLKNNTMNFLKGLVNTAGQLLEYLFILTLLAVLRHNFRWVYYPVKWFVATILALGLSAILVVAFKLLFGISEAWLGDLMYNIGTSTNIAGAGIVFIIWLLVFGTYTNYILGNIVLMAEGMLYGTNNVTRLTTKQSILWNLYGMVVYVLVFFKVISIGLSGQTSLFGIWS